MMREMMRGDGREEGGDGKRRKGEEAEPVALCLDK